MDYIDTNIPDVKILEPKESFKTGIAKTVQWYLNNKN
jgi:dTDP-D-glucose 4,6-dehydratase